MQKTNQKNKKQEASKTIRLGTDIVSLNQLKRVFSRSEDAFLKKVFSYKEIELSKYKRNKLNYYAKLFAFKETFVKCTGTGFNNKYRPRDIELHLYDRRTECFFKNQRIAYEELFFKKIKNNIICVLLIKKESFHEKSRCDRIRGNLAHRIW